MPHEYAGRLDLGYNLWMMWRKSRCKLTDSIEIGSKIIWGKNVILIGDSAFWICNYFKKNMSILIMRSLWFMCQRNYFVRLPSSCCDFRRWSSIVVHWCSMVITWEVLSKCQMVCLFCAVHRSQFGWIDFKSWFRKGHGSDGSSQELNCEVRNAIDVAVNTSKPCSQTCFSGFFPLLSYTHLNFIRMLFSYRGFVCQ